MALSLSNLFSRETAKAVVLSALAYSIANTIRHMLVSESKPALTESPLKTLLPKLSEQEKKQLSYLTNALPGARDVASPYGSIRVYEWGPEAGRKVLLVHGISSPSIALGSIAHELVGRGCRVMLFDLFGRGFSDCPDDLPQDSRLFCSQILIALASSCLSWTGRASGRFALIGYSLGGGIAASFTSYFPDLVSSLVLITPSGLLRPSRISFQTKVFYSQGLLPEPLLAHLVRKRLRGSNVSPSFFRSSSADAQPTELVKTEVSEQEPDSISAFSKHAKLNPADAVQFQLEHHEAFVRAYMSSMRYGPIMKEHATWACIGQKLSLQKEAKSNHLSFTGFDQDKVLIICANKDTSIVSSELVPDATTALEGNVLIRHFDAGHEVPISKSSEVADAIWDFWSA